ncbi:MAG: hypothetical protein CXR31_15070 [Geobacter sp.]|nr:MAG: hypothetical protein CXR31_15070 [Geobacter sp.]
MKKLALAAILALMTTGCATSQNSGFVFIEHFSQQRKLSAAVSQIEKGNVVAAANTLAELSAERGVAGVTDEALFRLSLLQLKAAGDKDYLQSQQTLERLHKEYPKSPWATQSAQLLDLVNAANEQRHQNRNLRASNQQLTKENQSLAKENKELRQTMEQLKHMDLQLEQKTKP